MKEQKIIIKKVKKVGGEGHHGGSWKVAYADFVTAMMAFFLLLWLISMVAPEKRARISAYFKHFSIFEQSGSSFMEKSSEVFSETGESAKKVPYEMYGQGAPAMKPEEFKESIKKAIEDKLSDIKDQVIVDIFEGGVRIQLVDKEGKPMFDLGSSRPTPMATRILQVIGDNIKSLPNPVAVEGHTDSLTYKSSSYSNWELSTERALTARKELERFGLDPSRLTRVAGYADTVPFIKEDPKDPRNRRISIILMFPQKSSQNLSSP
ncbi:MAG: flagellar motor protein MotB [Thermodesulfovibrionales bacterium]